MPLSLSSIISAHRTPRGSLGGGIALLYNFEHLFNRLCRFRIVATKHLFEFSLTLINRSIHLCMAIAGLFNFFGWIAVELHGVAQRFERWQFGTELLIDGRDVLLKRPFVHCATWTGWFVRWLPYGHGCRNGRHARRIRLHFSDQHSDDRLMHRGWEGRDDRDANSWQRSFIHLHQGAQSS